MKPTKPFEPIGPIRGGGPAVATKTTQDVMVQAAIGTLVEVDADVINEWVRPNGTSTPEIIKATEQAATAVTKATGIKPRGN
jgi:hypothetical protein